MRGENADTLPPLREIIARHDLAAKKSLGQNFLLDLNLTRKIARAAGPLDGCAVFEVGPGPGGLTRALLSEGAAHVMAIDPDTRLGPVMAEIGAHFGGRLTHVEGDALRCPLPPAPPGPHTDTPPRWRIIANLPYNIATPLLVRWLSSTPWPPWFEAMVLMFQREVAERITAPPGTKSYGRLSVLSQWRCHVERAFDIPPAAFTPPPKVTSTVVLFHPRAKPLPCAIGDLEAVTAAAFGQRRKMIRTSLKPALAGTSLTIDTFLAGAGLTGTERAETLPVEVFVALAVARGRAMAEGAPTSG